MNTPATSIYVFPGRTSYTWTYDGAIAGSSTVGAVAFDLSSFSGQQVTRGDFQYSVDNGRNWNAYVLPVDREGVFVPAAGTLWRFVDRTPGDNAGPGSFTMRWKLADASVVTSEASIVVDNAPIGVVDDRDTVFANLRRGAEVATLTPIDTGAPSGGRWVIDSQSAPGLFGIAYDPASDASARLVIADGALMPATGLAASVVVHYYDRYQLDTSGNPIAGQGASQALNYTVVEGPTHDLAGFGEDLAVGASGGAYQANPALATLSGGGFVAVWQGPDAQGGAIWAQLRAPSGAALGPQFALSGTGVAAVGEPAVSALAGGRFVVAYKVMEEGGPRVAYRVVEANGAAGPQLLAGDGSMPAVATLDDGSFVIGWSSGGAVHVRHFSAVTGAAVGAERVVSAPGTAFSPSIAALGHGDYVVAWGEIGDGNVYATLGSTPGAAPLLVDGSGMAATAATAAPLAHVAALAGGGFVVAWDSYRNESRGFSMSDIFFQRYDNAGKPLGELAQANVDSGDFRFDASVAALSDGGFVIAWQSGHGDYDANGVFGRRFGADGAAVDAHEFEINGQRQGDQASPALTALPGGGFAAAWVDTQAGGSAIEARVLAPAAIPAPGGDTGHASAADVTTAPLPDPVPAPAPVPVPVPAPAPANSGGVPAAAISYHLIEGDAGLDTVSYGGAHASYMVAREAGGFSVTSKLGTAHDALVQVERIAFSDASLALDIDGIAGQAYRLYQAAFDRTPDMGGLGYWIKMMDRGQTLNEVAAKFATSKEFADQYGAHSTDAQFVGLLYDNVLHRPAEGPGFDYWMNVVGNHLAPREQVLGFFSESAENQAQVIGSIQDGILFTPWG